MEQKHRSEFPENELWDLTTLYQDQEDFLRAIEKAREDIVITKASSVLSKILNGHLLN